MPGPVEPAGAGRGCARCGRARTELAPLTGALRWPAVFVMAFLHAGLWAGDLLSSRLCRPCRTRIAALCLLVTLGGLAAIAAGAVTLLGIARS